MNTPSRATAEINMGIAETPLWLAIKACSATDSGTGKATGKGTGKGTGSSKAAG
jgi:hypothetical protein